MILTGETLAELENRISILENSMPNRSIREIVLEVLKENQPPLETKWVVKQWDTVQQLLSEVRGWRKKHALTLKEVDRLKAKVDRTHKEYTII